MGRVIERKVSGIMEAMRVHGFQWTLRAVLSGNLAGVTGRTLIVTPPGSSKGIEESLDAL